MGKPPNEFTVQTIDQPDHERSDVQIRPLGLFLAGLVASVIFVGLLVWLLFDLFFATINIPAVESRPEPVPQRETGHPVLQVVPRRDVQVFRDREERVLNSTEWIDREKGIARIPIDAAMEQVASRGLPKWPAVAEQPSVETPTLPASPAQPTNSKSPQTNFNQSPR